MSKIFFWSGATTDACSFYRCIEPARVLRGRGHDVVANHQAGLADLMMSDVVVIQRPTEKTTQHAMEKLLSLPEGKRPRIVVELDDDLFSLPEHHPAHPMMVDENRRHRLDEAIRNADRVTVTNDHLRQQMIGRHSFGSDEVRVVPNFVPERFVVDKVPELGALGTPVITWAGSDTHRRDFDEVAVALRKLLRERTDFRVRIVGASYADRLRSALPPDTAFTRVSQVPWIEGVPRYIPTLTGHIGLAPLADDLFNRSKSDLRLKELAARGMAVVASTTGPYGLSGVPRWSAYPASTTGDWYHVIGAMLDNVPEREMVATKALDWARSNTLEAHAHEWETALLS